VVVNGGVGPVLFILQPGSILNIANQFLCPGIRIKKSSSGIKHQT